MRHFGLPRLHLAASVPLLLLLLSSCSAFSPSSRQSRTTLTQLYQQGESKNDQAEESSSLKRRTLLQTTAASLLIPPSTSAANAEDGGVYKPAKRPTLYRVDSTIPPTLLPIEAARDQTRLLKELANGRGTDKDAIVVDTLNLNNMLNKAVFGTANFVHSQLEADDSKTGMGYASFVCLGVPTEPATQDVALAETILSTLQNKCA